jgi:hypothetical protein
MKNIRILVVVLVISGLVQVGWLTDACPQAGAQVLRDPVLRDSPERSPDRQRFDPVTPEQIIRKDKDRVERYRAVPAPKEQGVPEKKAAKPETMKE